MPNSAPTRRLKEAAYALGDEYYRCVTAVSRSAGDMNHCVEVGRAYLEALESLGKHLATLHSDEEVDLLIQTTNGHISLVQSELESLENGGPHSH